MGVGKIYILEIFLQHCTLLNQTDFILILSHNNVKIFKDT